MKRPGSSRERGIALIVCLFALMLLSALGVGLMYMADTETSVNTNYRDSQRAYFGAVAGLEEVRERLMPTAPVAIRIAPPTGLPGTANPNGVVYVANYTASVPKNSIQPWNVGNAYFDSQLCNDNFDGLLLANMGANTPCPAAPAGTNWYRAPLPDSTSPFLGNDSNISWRWVRITQKVNKSAVPNTAMATSYYTTGSSVSDNTRPICWDGLYQKPLPAGYATCDDNPPPGTSPYLKSVYRLTSLAIAPGGSRRMAQMEVALDPPFVTNAALDTDDFVNTSGSSVTVNGYDNCQCACTLAVGGAAPTCVNRTTGAACTGNTYAIFTSQEVHNSGNPAIIAGTSPPVAEHQTFPYPLIELINKYKTMAGAVDTRGAPYNMNCTGSPLNCGTVSTQQFGTAPNPFPPLDPNNPIGVVNQISYIPGNVTLNAHTQGAGVLIVDGDLTIQGGMDFYGLILVKGVLTIQGSGQGQSTNVYGSIVAGQGSYADTIGGGVNLQFDRCALLNNMNPQPPLRLSFHEVSY